MKILIHDFAEHPFPFQLSRRLAEEGYTVYHIFSEFFQSPNRGNILNNKSVPNLNVMSVSLDEVYDKNDFIKRRNLEKKYGNKLVDKILEIKPDIVICSTTPLDPSRIVQKACRRNNIEYIFWLQDFYSIAINNIVSKKLPVIGSIIGRHYISLEKKIFKQSDHIIAITSDFIPILESWGINKKDVTVIPNWAPLNDIPLSSKNNEWSLKNSFDDKFCFIYSGTMGFKHNFSVLVKLAEHFKSNDNVKIIIISEGQNVDKLKKIAQENTLTNMQFYNFQPFKDMPEILASADVLVAVLEKDAGIYSVPSKVLTYLCSGRSLLLSMPKENLSSRIVTENTAGFVAAPDDDEEFIKYADILFNDEEKRNSCAKNARGYAENNFNIEAISKKFITIFNNMNNKSK